MKKKRKANVPLVAPPLKSRKIARFITSKFHKLNAALDSTLDVDSKQAIEAELVLMGGRERYQEASQLSTSFFSTSKWVIGKLQSFNVLHGVVMGEEEEEEAEGKSEGKSEGKLEGKSEGKSTRTNRRPTTLLEIGAINTTLIEAAKQSNNKIVTRAIDLRSSHEEIEQLDFLKMKENKDNMFDVIINSMVINSVPDAGDRAEMLLKTMRHLNYKGYVFLMLPLLCLNNSKFLTKSKFEDMLRGIGFDVVLKKETPKIFFVVLQKPAAGEVRDVKIKSEWRTGAVIRKEKKYRNTFSVVFGRNGETKVKVKAKNKNKTNLI